MYGLLSREEFLISLFVEEAPVASPTDYLDNLEHDYVVLAEIKDVIDSTEAANEVADIGATALMDVSDCLMDPTVTEQTLQAVMPAVEALLTIMKVSGLGKKKLPAMESVCVDRVRVTAEGLREIGNTIWEAIKAALKKLKEWFVMFWNFITGKTAREKARAKAIAKQATMVKSILEKMKISVDRAPTQAQIDEAKRREEAISKIIKRQQETSDAEDEQAKQRADERQSQLQETRDRIKKEAEKERQRENEAREKRREAVKQRDDEAERRRPTYSKANDAINSTKGAFSVFRYESTIAPMGKYLDKSFLDNPANAVEDAFDLAFNAYAGYIEIIEDIMINESSAISVENQHLESKLNKWAWDLLAKGCLKVASNSEENFSKVAYSTKMGCMAIRATLLKDGKSGVAYVNLSEDEKIKAIGALDVTITENKNGGQKERIRENKDALMEGISSFSLEGIINSCSAIAKNERWMSFSKGHQHDIESVEKLVDKISKKGEVGGGTKHYVAAAKSFLRIADFGLRDVWQYHNGLSKSVLDYCAIALNQYEQIAKLLGEA